MPKPMYVWSGSAWVSVASEVESLANFATQSYANNAADVASGLKPLVPSSVAIGSGSSSVSTLGQVTFTGASSVSLNDVFSATYNAYKIIIRITDTASDGFMNLRFRVSGTDATAANYSSAYYGVSAAFSADAGGSSATTAAYVGYSENANEFAFGAVELVNPFLTQPTIFNSIGAYKTAANNLTILNCGGGLDNTTSYTGFTLLMPGGGNATGTVSVYGYKV
jgi:hypothetical protein